MGVFPSLSAIAVLLCAYFYLYSVGEERRWRREQEAAIPNGGTTDECLAEEMYLLEEIGKFDVTGERSSVLREELEWFQHFASAFGSNSDYQFWCVSDPDQRSRDPQLFRWTSHLKSGILHRLPNGNFSVHWRDTKVLESEISRQNRSMELSELVMYDGNLLAFDDITGLVYRVMTHTGDVFVRHALADGSGKRSKPFKTEWATIYDERLIIGSVGFEWIEKGRINHFDPVWIKVVDLHGGIRSLDWQFPFSRMRESTNTSHPGYLLHEAIVFDQRTRHWLAAPRRASKRAYDPISDEHEGANLLLIADEFFENVEVRTIGPLEPDWGFSSIKIVPDTHELVLLKVQELSGSFQTKMVVYDQDGNSKLEGGSVLVSDHEKYEGIEFARGGGGVD